MNIRFKGIDGIGGNEVIRLFSTLKDDFDFIKEVGIRQFHKSWCDGVDIYDVTIEIKPDRDDVSIHIFDDSVYIVDCGCKHQAKIYIDRSAYERLEII